MFELIIKYTHQSDNIVVIRLTRGFGVGLFGLLYQRVEFCLGHLISYTRVGLFIGS